MAKTKAARLAPVALTRLTKLRPAQPRHALPSRARVSAPLMASGASALAPRSLQTLYEGQARRAWDVSVRGALVTPP